MEKLKGRVFFLGMPIAVGAAVHAVLAAVMGEIGLLSPLAAAVTAIVTAGIVGWRRLDDQAAYVLNKRAYEPAMLLSLIPAAAMMLFGNVQMVAGAIAVAFFFFGGMAALAPISEYVEVDEPTSRDILVARLACALQASLLLAALCSSSPLVAAAISGATALAMSALVVMDAVTAPATE